VHEKNFSGYLNHFPFMEESLRMRGDTTLYPPNLYKGTVWTAGGSGRLMYVGMQGPILRNPISAEIFSD
jgi:hypothetical protein